MTRLRRFLPPGLCLAAGLLLATITHAAEPEAGDRWPQAEAAIAAAEAARAGAGENDPDARDVNAALAAARGAGEKVRLLEEQRASVLDESRRAERERPRLQTALTLDADRAFEVWKSRISTSARGAALEEQLARELDALEAARKRAQEASAALARNDGGIGDAERFATLTLQQEDLVRQLQASTPEVRARTVDAARHAQSLAELAAVEAELRLLEASRQSAEQRSLVTQLQAEVAQRDASLATRRVAWLESLVGEASRREFDELDATVTEQLTRSAETPLQALAEGNRALLDELMATANRLLEKRQHTQQLLAARDLAAEALSRTEARLKLTSNHESIGQMLQAERRQLERPAQLAAQLDEVQTELTRLRLRLLELPGQDADPADTAQAVVEPELRKEQAALRSLRHQLIDALDERLKQLEGVLAQADIALRRQLQDTAAVTAMLDRELMWIPSHAPVTHSWLLRQLPGWRDFLSPQRWLDSLALLWGRVEARPWPLLLGAVLAIALLLQRARIRATIQSLVPPYRRISQDRFRLTMRALGWTLLHALPLPLALAVLGYEWQAAGEPGRFSHSLGLTLSYLASSLLLLEFVRALNLERGVAHSHFRWTRARRESISWALRHAAFVLLPLQFVAGLAFARGVEPGVDVCARLAVALFALYSGWMTWAVLAPGGVWTPRGKAEPHRWRMLLRGALPLLLLCLVLLLAVGYVYSASVLVRALWQSLWTVVLVAIGQGLLARWFLLGERRLAYERLLAQREAERLGERAAAGEELPDIGDEIVSLESVNAQTSRLLRAATLSLWVVGLLWVWMDIIPALARLDEIALWNVADVDADGDPVRVAVTLNALLFGVAALALTWVAARNLPGLLEIGLLSRISIDAPSRYAIASILRYLIVIVGSMVGLGLLGLRWSQLQWMAAALSVGLGFGLQEIFGNFVSGLILLFERPFRVGDIITIGEFSGTVTKIRTRATTLVDFDNKEVVVPNKAFITDRLINWTLSDTRTRIVIRLGVAYGSDIAAVHRLLIQAASEHPQVLGDPEPTSWLVAFGPSSLDFELRVFVAAIADRMPVTNDINTRIAALFAEHAVEISYPQMDVHIRDLPAKPERYSGAADTG